MDDKLEALLELESIENARVKRKSEFGAYNYDDTIPVPRVTKIIDSVMDKSFLYKYVASFGNYYAYLRERDIILSIGEQVHLCIDYFLETGKDREIDYKKYNKQAYYIENAYNNFKAWYNNLLSTGNTFELIGLEVPVVSPYYGGCCDCLCKINGATYLLDFKTSKKITYDYIIQTIFYMNAINAGYCKLVPHIDGIGIIRVDKEAELYEDLFLNDFNAEGHRMIEYYTSGAMSILSTYYNKINMEYTFNQYKKNYTGIDNVINNLIDTPVIPEEEV